MNKHQFSPILHFYCIWTWQKKVTKLCKKPSVSRAQPWIFLLVFTSRTLVGGNSRILPFPWRICVSKKRKWTYGLPNHDSLQRDGTEIIPNYNLSCGLSLQHLSPCLDFTNVSLSRFFFFPKKLFAKLQAAFGAAVFLVKEMEKPSGWINNPRQHLHCLPAAFLGGRKCTYLAAQ